MINPNRHKNHALEYNQKLINFLNCIKAHFFFLVLNDNNYQIRHVSENTEDFLVFYPSQVKKNLQELTNNNHNNYKIYLKIKLFSKICQVLIPRNNNNIIIELENYLELKNNKNNLLEIIRKSIYNLKKANHFTEICQEITVYIKNITQYGGMMIYNHFQRRSFIRDSEKVFRGKIYLCK